MKEYKAECLAMLAQSSRKKREQILNARALAGWELVSVSGGWAYYEREKERSESESVGQQNKHGRT